MTDTVLIVAAGPLQVPAIEESKAAGLRTIAVDGNSNAPGLSVAHLGITVDIHDVAGVAEIARRETVRGLMTLCTDQAVNTVAAVAEALGLPGLTPKAAANATDKRHMRREFSLHRVPSPESFEVHDIENALAAAGKLGYPVALKIARSSGSRGVYQVVSLDELREYFPLARSLQPSGALLLEEWVDGPEVSVEGICFGGCIHVVQITDKCVFSGPFPVESGHTQPSRLSSHVQEAIRACAVAGVKALGLTDTAFHAELKVTRRGPRIIEIGARLGGDRISTHLTKISTGVNLVRAALEVAIGRVPDIRPRWSQGAAIRYFVADRCGFVDRVDGLEDMRSMDGFELLFAASERDGPLQKGFSVNPIRSSVDRYGHVIFSGSDAEQAAKRAESALQRVAFRFV